MGTGALGGFEQVGLEAVLKGVTQYVNDAERARRANLNLESSIDKVARGSAGFQQKFQNFGRSAAQAGTALTAGLTLPILAVGGIALKSAVDFETAFTGVEKTVGGTVEQMDELREATKRMAVEFAQAPANIAKVFEIGGQLGIQRENLEGFAEAILKIDEATVLTAEDAATGFARFSNIMRTPQTEIGRLGSIVAKLGDAGASTEAEILDMGLRIAGAGKIAGLSEAEIFGFANALSSVGLESELGGSAISRLILQIAQAVAEGGTQLTNFATVAGVSADQFATSFRDNAAGAIIQFLEGIGKLDTDAAITALDKLDIAEIRLIRTILSGAKAGPLFADSLKVANAEAITATKLDEEFARRADDVAFKLRQKREEARLAAITFGDALIPVLLKALDAATPLIAAFASMAKAFAGLPAPIQLGILGLVGLAVVLGPVLVVLGALAFSITAIVGLAPALGTTWAAIGAGAIGVLGPVLLVIAVLAALGLAAYVIYKNWGSITAGIAKSWDVATDKITIAGQAVLSFFQKYWPLIGAVILLPFIGPLAIALGLVIFFRSELLGTFRTVYGAAQRLFGGALDLGLAFVRGIVRFFASAVERIRTTVYAIPRVIVEAIQGGTGAVFKALANLVRGMISLLNPYNWVFGSTLPEVFGRLGGESIQALNKALHEQAIDVPDVTLPAPEVLQLVFPALPVLPKFPALSAPEIESPILPPLPEFPTVPPLAAPEILPPVFPPLPAPPVVPALDAPEILPPIFPELPTPPIISALPTLPPASLGARLEPGTVELPAQAEPPKFPTLPPLAAPDVAAIDPERAVDESAFRRAGALVPKALAEGITKSAKLASQSAGRLATTAIQLLNPYHWVFGSTMPEVFARIGQESGGALSAGMVEELESLDDIPDEILNSIFPEESEINRLATRLARALGVPFGSEVLRGFASTARAAVERARRGLASLPDIFRNLGSDSADAFNVAAAQELRNFGLIIDSNILSVLSNARDFVSGLHQELSRLLGLPTVESASEDIELSELRLKRLELERRSIDESANKEKELAALRFQLGLAQLAGNQVLARSLQQKIEALESGETQSEREIEVIDRQIEALENLSTQRNLERDILQARGELADETIATDEEVIRQAERMVGVIGNVTRELEHQLQAAGLTNASLGTLLQTMGGGASLINTTFLPSLTNVQGGLLDSTTSADDTKDAVKELDDGLISFSPEDFLTDLDAIIAKSEETGLSLDERLRQIRDDLGIKAPTFLDKLKASANASFGEVGRAALGAGASVLEFANDNDEAGTKSHTIFGGMRVFIGEQLSLIGSRFTETGALFGRVAESIGTSVSGIASGFYRAVPALAEAFKYLINTVIISPTERGINWVIDGINGLLSKIRGVQSFLGALNPFGGGGPEVSNIQPIAIPRLQAGGIVTGPMIAQLAERGRPEAVIPLSAGFATMGGERALARAIAAELSGLASGGGSSFRNYGTLNVRTGDQETATIIRSLMRAVA